MSEEAAAAIDADAARDNASQSKAHKPFSDSAHGFDNPDGVTDGVTNGYTKPQETVDASQVAEKVGVAVFGPACVHMVGCCHNARGLYWCGTTALPWSWTTYCSPYFGHGQMVLLSRLALPALLER